MEQNLFAGEKKQMKYCSDYVDLLVNDIKQHQTLTIEAPPGTGKTTMLSGFLKDKKRVSTGLIDYFPKSLIINVTNANNSLYDCPTTNIVGSYNTNKISKTKVNVMVIDQFNIHFNQIEENIPDVIFVDESHHIYIDQTFRDSACEFFENLLSLRQRGAKIVFISATPAGEVMLFNSHVIRLSFKDPRVIKYEFVGTESTFESMLRDMRSVSGGNSEFERLAIFSNRDAQALFEKGVWEDMDINIIHQGWKHNVERLTKVEMLESQITTLTCVAFDGLNIRNKDEKLLIDIRYSRNETTLNEILQITGRFRECQDITVRLYVDGTLDGKSMQEIQNDINDAVLLNETQAYEFQTEYYQRLVDVGVQRKLKDVAVWKGIFTLRTIATELKNKGCIVRGWNDNVSKDARVKPLKKLASNIMKMKIVLEIPVEDYGVASDYNVSKYLDNWTRRIRKLYSRYDEGLMTDIVIRMVCKNDVCVSDEKEKVKEVLESGDRKEIKETIDGIEWLNKNNVETQLKKLEETLRIYDMTDEQWDVWKTTRSVLLTKPISNKLRRKVDGDIKKHDNMRKQFEGMNLNDVLQAVIDCQVDVMERFLEGNSRGGKKKGKKNNIKKITDGNYVWSSCKEAALMLGVSVQTISKRIKNGLLWKVN